MGVNACGATLRLKLYLHDRSVGMTRRMEETALLNGVVEFDTNDL